MSLRVNTNTETHEKKWFVSGRSDFESRLTEADHSEDHQVTCVYLSWMKYKNHGQLVALETFKVAKEALLCSRVCSYSYEYEQNMAVERAVSVLWRWHHSSCL